MIQVEQLLQVREKRYRAVFSDGRSLPLYAGDLRRFRLVEGAELSEAQAEEIYHTCVQVRARKKVLALLERCDQPEKELRRKLEAAGYGPDAASDAIEYAKQYGYIDDLRYAREYIRVKSQTKSRRQIEHELKQKGIPKEALAELFSDGDGDGSEAEQEAIRRFLRKKLPAGREAEPQEKQKAAAALFRKGFPMGLVWRELEFPDEP